MSNKGYIIRERLNESSTTAVYTAFHPALNRTVLLKILHKHLIADKDFVDRFVREARACALLRSEHIVQVYDLTEIDGAPAIVMEYIDGPSLKTVIEQRGAQTPTFVRRAALHILRALHLAHERNIIHRDIKPGNILLAPSDILKVTDFGLATIPQSPTITNDGAILGTPAYMSPEQIHAETLDGRTDLFSLGVTLVELLTRKRLFDGSTYAECIKKIMLFKGDFTIPEGIPDSPELKLFLQKLLAPDINNRFATAREALAALGEQEPVEVVIPKHLAVRTHMRTPYILAATAVVIISAALWFFTPAQYTPAGTQTSDRKDSVSTAHTSDVGKNGMVNVQREAAHTPPESISQKGFSAPQSPAIPPVVPTAVTASDTGWLRIVCTPWAKVYLNNQYLGETPIAKPLRVKAGTCIVTFNNPMFSPIVKNVTVRGSEETLVEADFLSTSGFLVVRATPWAEVFIDDQYRETTPLKKPLILSAGAHKIRLHNPAFSDVVRDVTVTAHDTTGLSITLLRGDTK